MLVIGVIGALTVDSGGSNVAAISGTSSTTSLGGATSTTAASTDTTSAGGTATTAGRSTATTSGSSKNAPVPNPGPTKPPKPGKYTYTVTNSTEASANGDTDATVEALPDSNGSPRRRETYKDPSGNTLSNDETWASDAVRITVSHITGGGNSADCTWKPPMLLLALPLAVGKEFDTDSTCTATFQNVPITIHRVSHSKVTGKILDKVGSVSVPAWIIETTGTTSIKTPFGSNDSTESGTRHFSSDRGLLLYEKASAKSGDTTIAYERTLKSVDPS
jgi:hypothetical protein